MSQLTRTKPLDEIGDLNAPIGSRLWLLGVANEIRKTLYDKEQTGRRLQDLIEAFKQYAGWQEFGYLTWEEYCESRLQSRAEEIDSEVARRAQAAKPSMTSVEAASLAANVRHGNVRLDNYQAADGTSADYLTARIARDRPDILDDMKKGKYRSVRQAAIAAGIIHPRQRYSLPDDPQAAGRYLAQRVDKEWLLAMVDEAMKSL
jgi:hypothetical protein